MPIKLSKIISCTSQHPSYPATNLLEYKSSKDSSTWLCGKPGILESEVVFELSEPAPVTGVELGNSRCCSVRISGATDSQPDNWVTIIEHEFMSRNDAEDGRFRDQVKLFTKRELNEEIVKIVFSRVKATCMQPANLKVLFGLSIFVLRTEEKTDTGDLDAFGRFKVKQNKDDSLDKFKEKYLQQIRAKPGNFKTELSKQIGEKRAMMIEEKTEVTPRKRPSLNLTRPSPEPEAGNKAATTTDLNERPIKRTKLSDGENKTPQNSFPDTKKAGNSSEREATSFGNSKKLRVMPEQRLSKDMANRGRPRCSLCLGNEENVLCNTCNLLKPDKEEGGSSGKGKPKQTTKPAKPVKEFAKLFERVVFSLSGYKNPERDEIRKKAIAMGARYIGEPKQRNHGCTHLVCAFKNTPKYNQLKGSSKIVSHRWVEECYEKKTRFPWRRYALDIADKNAPESEDEIMASTKPAPPSIYDQDTDDD